MTPGRFLARVIADGGVSWEVYAEFVEGQAYPVDGR